MSLSLEKRIIEFQNACTILDAASRDSVESQAQPALISVRKEAERTIAELRTDMRVILGYHDLMWSHIKAAQAELPSAVSLALKDPESAYAKYFPRQTYSSSGQGKTNSGVSRV